MSKDVCCDSDIGMCNMTGTQTGKYLAEAKIPRTYCYEGYRFDCSYMNLN